MGHARLRLVEQALNEQFCSAVTDWNRRGCPANRAKALRKLQSLSDAAWCAAQATMPPLYEGVVERGVDPDPV